LSGTLEIACEAPANGSNLGSCTFSQTLLRQLFPPNGLGLVDCQYGECVSQGVIDIVQGNVDPAATATNKEDGLSGGVIAGLAVVGTIVLAILALIGWGLLTQKKARKIGAVSLDDSAFGRRKGFGAGVEWSNVGYHSKRPQNRKLATLGRKSSPTEGKIILEGVTGKLNPGGLCCVLGPSGAGKSTFVDILGGRRKAAGRVVGKVHFFGNDTSSGGAKVRHRVGFVDQVSRWAETLLVSRSQTDLLQASRRMY
jgi:ABC-type multidrug transport system fused ATPase/permease subunit